MPSPIQPAALDDAGLAVVRFRPAPVYCRGMHVCQPCAVRLTLQQERTRAMSARAKGVRGDRPRRAMRFQQRAQRSMRQMSAGRLRL